jgi:Fe-S cluster biogenesis protein NfuA
VEAAVADAIDRLRPAIEGDGGTIELRSVDSARGVVRVALSGSCAGCSTSSGTLLAGISRIVRDHVPAVQEIVNVADPTEPSETSVGL